MKLETLSQAIEYTYSVNGKNKSRIMENVKETATPESLVQVGTALTTLMGKDLQAATLIKREGIDLSAAKPAGK